MPYILHIRFFLPPLHCKGFGKRLLHHSHSLLRRRQYQKPFLQEVDSITIRKSIFHLDDNLKKAYNYGFGYPKFKSKFGFISFNSAIILVEVFLTSGLASSVYLYKIFSYNISKKQHLLYFYRCRNAGVTVEC